MAAGKLRGLQIAGFIYNRVHGRGKKSELGQFSNWYSSTRNRRIEPGELTTIELLMLAIDHKNLPLETFSC